MKKYCIRTTLTLLLSMCAFTQSMAVEENEENTATVPANRRVLVIGLDGNIKSNYYDPEMLSEGTGIVKDSLCSVYNEVIENNLAKAAGKEKSKFHFIPVQMGEKDWKELTSNVTIKNDDEHSSSDWSKVNSAELRALMKKTPADYLLVLDTHYLKYQEKPFKTVFHFINYSLYNDKKEKLTQGSSYFTSFAPQSEKEMANSSRKSSQKIVSDIVKTINK